MKVEIAYPEIWRPIPPEDQVGARPGLDLTSGEEGVELTDVREFMTKIEDRQDSWWLALPSSLPRQRRIDAIMRIWVAGVRSAPSSWDHDWDWFGTGDGAWGRTRWTRNSPRGSLYLEQTCLQSAPGGGSAQRVRGVMSGTIGGVGVQAEASCRHVGLVPTLVSSVAEVLQHSRILRRALV